MTTFLKLGRKPTPVMAIDERDARVVWRVAAFLLDYPSEQTMAMLDDLTAAAATVPEPAGPALLSFLDYAKNTPVLELAADYVETFDLRRRNSMHLSYYAHGDTRGRGMALLRFKHAYRSAGVDFADDGELPDHLAVVLEFAATVDPAQGARLLGEHVPVLELLRLSLVDNGSRYAEVLSAVLATLPPLTTADRRKIEQLAKDGPPEDTVGLEPFAMDPTLEPSTGGRR